MAGENFESRAACQALLRPVVSLLSSTRETGKQVVAGCQLPVTVWAPSEVWGSALVFNLRSQRLLAIQDQPSFSFGLATSSRHRCFFTSLWLIATRPSADRAA